MGKVQEWFSKFWWAIAGVFGLIWYATRIAAAKALGKAEAKHEQALEEYDTAIEAIEDQVEERDTEALKRDTLEEARRARKARSSRSHGR